MVKIGGTLELQSTKPNGVRLIRKSFLETLKIKKPPGVKVSIYAVSAPKYRIEVSAENYKEAETTIKTAAEIAIKSITSAGGQGGFNRDR